MKSIFIISLTLFVLSCHTDVHKASNKNLDQLVQLMSGSFSSLNQSHKDKDYYDIRLEMAPIWQNSSDGKWLYVEQAVSTHLDKPYRQRVYHVTESENGTYSSAVYELPDTTNYIGAYSDTSKFDSLTPDKLKVRQGCAVILKKTNESTYAGSTDAKKCLSSLRGASYATSVVTINKDSILSWDRGFDSNDNHVWGAEKGAYKFDRK